MRVAGSGRWSAETSPTDVESPTCTTDVHDVRPSPGSTTAAVVGAADGTAPLDPVGAGVDTVATIGACAVAGVASADDERDASTHAPTTARTANAGGSVTGPGRYRRVSSRVEHSPSCAGYGRRDQARRGSQ